MILLVAERLIGVAGARSMLGVSSRTLRRYTAEGRLPDRRSPGGRRIFSLAEIAAIQHRRGRATPEFGAGAVVLYGRVSSRRQAQAGELERQMDALRRRAQARRVAGEFTDVASGLSDRRSGLRRALRACLSPEVTELWVTDFERLARFGVGVIEQLLSAHGVQIVVVCDGGAIASSADSDLVRDLLWVVTACSGRLYGQGSVQARTLRAWVAHETKLR